MKKELIVKHNKLIEGKYNLDTWEIKIIAKVSSLIQKDDDDFKEFTFKSSDMLNELGFGLKNHIQLKETIEKLITKKITIQKEKETLVTTFLSSCIYRHDTSEIILRFDPNLKPYLLQLKDNFTKCYLEDVLSLSSFYAIRIYELCKQYEKIKERKIDVIQLKEILEIENKYKKYNDFKKYVLEIAEREINEKTDIHISFEEIKTSRKVTSIKFNIEKKELEKSEIKEAETAEKTYSEEVERLYEKIKEIERIESLKDVIEESVELYGIERIESNIKYSNDNSKTNYTAFLKKALKEDYARIEREKELKKAEEKRKREEEDKKKEQEEAEKKEREKQELKELKNYLIKSEEGVFAVRYRDNKYIKKDVVTFDMYVESLIETVDELKEKLNKRRNNISKYLHQLERIEYTKIGKEAKKEYEEKYNELRPFEQKKWKSKKQYVIEQHRLYLNEERAIILNEDEKEILKKMKNI